MASMTDYIVLSDSPFELDNKALGASDTKILTFRLPADFTPGTNHARPVLAFIVHVVSDDASLGIWVNSEFPLKQTTREHSLAWNNTRHGDVGLWEAIQGTMFKAGEENRIIFAMQPGDKGHVRFRDVVLWYQRGAGA